jgi:hypothetical protein
MADAKPFWSGLHQWLTPVDAADYEYRRSSIYKISQRCIRLRIVGNLLKEISVVAREGVERFATSCFL